MSITEELRTEARGFGEYLYTSEQAQRFLGIADRIDAEHERRCNEQYACGAEDGISASIEALVIQTHGFIELPKDADGEYIHLGDVMEWCNGSFTVHELKLTEDGWQTWDSEHGYTVHADECIRHHHAPTVEDVLREFAMRTDEIPNDASGIEPFKALVADFAKRLRLAGDAE